MRRQTTPQASHRPAFKSLNLQLRHAAPNPRFDSKSGENLALAAWQSVQNVLSHIFEHRKIFLHSAPDNLVINAMVGVAKDVTHAAIAFLIDLRIV